MFPDRLHTARTAKGLSMRQLALAAQAVSPDVPGINAPRVNDWEKGRRPMPDLPKLLALASALDVDHLWLAGEEERGGPAHMGAA